MSSVRGYLCQRNKKGKPAPGEEAAGEGGVGQKLKARIPSYWCESFKSPVKPASWSRSQRLISSRAGGAT